MAKNGSREGDSSRWLHSGTNLLVLFAVLFHVARVTHAFVERSGSNRPVSLTSSEGSGRTLYSASDATMIGWGVIGRGGYDRYGRDDGSCPLSLGNELNEAKPDSQGNYEYAGAGKGGAASTIKPMDVPDAPGFGTVAGPNVNVNAVLLCRQCGSSYQCNPEDGIYNEESMRGPECSRGCRDYYCVNTISRCEESAEGRTWLVGAEHTGNNISQAEATVSVTTAGARRGTSDKVQIPAVQSNPQVSAGGSGLGRQLVNEQQSTTCSAISDMSGIGICRMAGGRGSSSSGTAGGGDGVSKSSDEGGSEEPEKGGEARATGPRRSCGVRLGPRFGRAAVDDPGCEMYTNDTDRPNTVLHCKRCGGSCKCDYGASTCFKYNMRGPNCSKDCRHCDCRSTGDACAGFVGPTTLEYIESYVAAQRKKAEGQPATDPPAA